MPAEDIHHDEGEIAWKKSGEVLIGVSWKKIVALKSGILFL